MSATSVGRTRPSGRYQVAIPLSDGQDERRGHRGVNGLEGPGCHAVRDDAPEPQLVRVAATGDLRASVARERPPLVHEDARPLDVVGHDRHVRLRQRGQPRGVAVVRVGARSQGGVRGRLEPRRRPLHDRPEDVLLGRDVRVEARALDVERPGDVAHARTGVATLAKERAGHVIDLAATRRLDHGAGDLPSQPNVR